MILVLGVAEDPHVSRVLNCIEDAGGVDVEVLDFQAETEFELNTSENGIVQLKVAGRQIHEHALIWDRGKIVPNSFYYPKHDDDSNGFIAQEWRALYQLVCYLNAGRVVNSRESRVCQIKPYQQRMAALAGFPVPATLISNDASQISTFHFEHGSKSILKSLSGGSVTQLSPEGNTSCVIMTVPVTSENLESAAPDQFESCPHFFQKQLEKAFELRVVVVDSHVLAYHIDSQKEKIAEVDWRRGQFVLDFRPYEINDELRVKLLSYMKVAGLFAGSFDLVVDKQGITWFIECNQDGQWVWLDDIDNGAIAHAYARGLHQKSLELTKAA
jgi:glutathione synthase/RimK-type ligase-like ATP-grasp enzyme